jgi:hypothetical protein
MVTTAMRRTLAAAEALVRKPEIDRKIAELEAAMTTLDAEAEKVEHPGWSGGGSADQLKQQRAVADVRKRQAALRDQLQAARAEKAAAELAAAYREEVPIPETPAAIVAELTECEAGALVAIGIDREMMNLLKGNHDDRDRDTHVKRMFASRERWQLLRARSVVLQSALAEHQRAEALAAAAATPDTSPSRLELEARREVLVGQLEALQADADRYQLHVAEMRDVVSRWPEPKADPEAEIDQQTEVRLRLASTEALYAKSQKAVEACQRDIEAIGQAIGDVDRTARQTAALALLPEMAEAADRLADLCERYNRAVGGSTTTRLMVTCRQQAKDWRRMASQN